VEAPVAVRAGKLRARRQRRTRAISLADAVAAEVARSRRTPLATSDPHLLDTRDAEGIEHVPRPDTSGAVWRPSA
jgi:predicted nucleic acid-binding protein